MRSFFFVVLAAVVSCAFTNARGDDDAKESATPISGEKVEALASYDRMMTGLLEEYKIPGGAIAVAKDGKLIFSRGYGYADAAAKRPVEPDALFRIASVSKPITAVAILRLVEQEKVKLDEPALAILGTLDGPPGASVDSRLATITVRQLLHHTGGWDRDKSFDAMFVPGRAAAAVGAPAPAEAMTVIRFMLGQKLDFDPGDRYAYSNLGYAILGRIIERRTGLSYCEAVQQLVFTPAGITRIRLGRTLPGHRAKDEVAYHDYDPDARTECVFPYVKDKVAWPDGGFFLEAMDAHGGWIASASDLVRFASAVEGRGREPLLSQKSIESMLARADGKPLDDKESHYALGWNVRAGGDNGGTNWWHTGSLPGTSSLLVRAHNGLAWAALFNSRPEGNRRFPKALDAACWKAAEEVKEWPGEERK